MARLQLLELFLTNFRNSQDFCPSARPEWRLGVSMGLDNFTIATTVLAGGFGKLIGVSNSCGHMAATHDT
jgi:hypothetical protein